MRHEATATSISWIPSEAVKGMTKLPFEMGVAHYDATPPERLGPDDLAELQAPPDRFRFANHLKAWIDVETARSPVGERRSGLIGSTVMSSASGSHFAAVLARPAPGTGSHRQMVRFTQTAGGRTGVPTPRRVNRPPFVQVLGPTGVDHAAVTLFADRRPEVTDHRGQPVSSSLAVWQ